MLGGYFAGFGKKNALPGKWEERDLTADLTPISLALVTSSRAAFTDRFGPDGSDGAPANTTRAEHGCGLERRHQCFHMRALRRGVVIGAEVRRKGSVRRTVVGV